MMVKQDDPAVKFTLMEHSHSLKGEYLGLLSTAMLLTYHIRERTKDYYKTSDIPNSYVFDLYPEAAQALGKRATAERGGNMEAQRGALNAQRTDLTLVARGLHGEAFFQALADAASATYKWCRQSGFRNKWTRGEDRNTSVHRTENDDFYTSKCYF
jgi:hypothetical protein